MASGGDEVHGDRVEGNKVEIGSIVNTGSGQVNVAGGDINIFQRIVNFFQGDTEAQRAFRNRQNMLQLVWNTWIEGVLKKSLHNEVLIELGMETKPDAVEHPWDMVMQMPDREPEMVAPGTTMLELFDQSNGSLLILGEPGSGKTTMLLELARLAISRAQEDPLQPIPVVFNLSSWKPEQTIADWIENELRDKYYVSTKVGRPWIENNTLMLLLDGLDEVAAENRELCVQIINAFRAEHNLPLVVCSRRQEYEALAACLKLRGALLIQALSTVQVEEYLQKAGADLEAVRKVLRRDAELREFAQTPLILNILVLAYRDEIEKDLQLLETERDLRQQLFDAYIAQMFKRRKPQECYPEEEIRQFLGWLASKMIENKQSVFVLEMLNRNWLNSNFQKWFHRLLIPLPVGLIIMLLSLWMGKRFYGWLGMILFVLLGVGLFALTDGFFTSKDVIPAERLVWSWRDFRWGLFMGFFCGMLFAGFWGPSARILFGTSGDLLQLLFNGLPGWILSILIWGLFGGLVIGLKPAQLVKPVIPGYGIRSSLFNALFVGPLLAPLHGLFIGLVGILSFWIFMGWLAVWIDNIFGVLLYILTLGVFIGLLTNWLQYGMGFLVLHFTIRLLLYFSDHLPWNLIPFLDFCTDRIFLRRVGGGYIFIHRMLMEYFAEMNEERVQAIAQKVAER